MTQFPPSNDPNNPRSLYPQPDVMPGYPQPAVPSVEPANGSVVQAWTQSALPNRRRIAPWAQATTQSWVTTSIIVAAVISVIGSVIGNTIIYAGHPVTTLASTNGQPQVIKTTVGSIIANGISQAISTVGFLLLLSLFLALFMPATFGTLGARFQRVLKPVALIAVSVEVIGLILSAIGGYVFVQIAPSLETITRVAAANPNNPDTTAIQNALGPIIGFGSLFTLIGIVYLAYIIAQSIQAGSLGSTLNRWAVFGTMLLAAIVTGIVGFVVGLPLHLLY